MLTVIFNYDTIGADILQTDRARSMSDTIKVYVFFEIYEGPEGGTHIVTASTNKEVIFRAAKEKFTEHRSLRERGKLYGHKKLFEATLAYIAYNNETGEPIFEEDKNRPEYYIVTEGKDGEIVLTNFIELHGDCRKHMKKRLE